MRKELTDMHEFINDLWKLIKKYPDVPDKKADTFWMELVEDSCQISEKYKDYPVASKMLCCWLDHLEGKDDKSWA